MGCSQLPEKALRLTHQSSTQHWQHRLQSVAIISRGQGRYFLPSLNYCLLPTLYELSSLNKDFCYQQKKDWERKLLTDQNSIKYSEVLDRSERREKFPIYDLVI